MKPSQIWFWTLLAAGLLVVILLLRMQKPPVPAGPQTVLPQLNTGAVTSVQVRPSGPGSLQIRAERTNGTWQLVEPFVYPAQPTNVTRLLDALALLKAATYITPAEVRSRANPEEEFGFVTPQASIILQQGGYRAHVLVGNFTAPGDQVFLQVVAREGVYVVDAGWLKAIPRSANAWRDRALVEVELSSIDRLAVTNNSRAFALQKDTNTLWRMAWPLSSARADNARIEDALHRLAHLEIQQFISDDPKPDLEAFGLGKPDLEVALGQGTNTVALLQFGKAVAGVTNQVYARRSGQHTVFTVPAPALASWRGASVNDFRDPHLVTLTEPIGAIDVSAGEEFSVMRQTNGSWTVRPQDYPADAALVGDLLGALTNLQVLQFTKDVVNAPELPEFGLASPIRKYSLQSSAVLTGGAAATNCLIVELDFGLATNAADKVFVRRTDESSVYAISTNDFARLPVAGWQLQERKLWNFTEQDVAKLRVRQQGKTLELLRKGDHLWSLAPGSQGIINDLAVEQTTRGLARASARAWVARNPADLEPWGLARPHELTFVLKDGASVDLAFGGTGPAESQYALIKRGDATYVVELPWYLYRDVASYLSIR